MKREIGFGNIVSGKYNNSADIYKMSSAALVSVTIPAVCANINATGIFGLHASIHESETNVTVIASSSFGEFCDLKHRVSN